MAVDVISIAKKYSPISPLIDGRVSNVRDAQPYTAVRGKMSTTVRPQLTTAIAALSAGAIIATTVATTPQHPIAMTFPLLPGVTTSVELATWVNPLSAIDQALQTTVTGVQQFVTGLSTNPVITALMGSTVSTLKQLVTIGQSALSDIGSSLTEDLSTEAQTVLQLVQAGNWQSALNLVDSTAKTIKSVPPVILQAVLVGSVNQLLQSVAPGITALQTALKSGNLGNALNAVVSITKTVISTVLGQAGLISQLVTIAQALSQISSSATAAVKPAATAATLAAVPSTSAKMLTLPSAVTSAAVASAASASQKSTVATASKDQKNRGKKPAVAATPSSSTSPRPASSESTSDNTSGPTGASPKNIKGSKSIHNRDNRMGDNARSNGSGRGAK